MLQGYKAHCWKSKVALHTDTHSPYRPLPPPPTHLRSLTHTYDRAFGLLRITESTADASGKASFTKSLHFIGCWRPQSCRDGRATQQEELITTLSLITHTQTGGSSRATSNACAVSFFLHLLLSSQPELFQLCHTVSGDFSGALCSRGSGGGRSGKEERAGRVPGPGAPSYTPGLVWPPQRSFSCSLRGAVGLPLCNSRPLLLLSPVFHRSLPITPAAHHPRL